ncbi:MAG: hypothetical protein JWM80_6437 [Cyanobacteria bacterium RYN_339]|nr:hypothetical protein [Cyanobacteria bacterium RYN_339]
MAGGDSRVQFGAVGGMGALNQIKTIDANSKASGDMKCPVEVGGKTVYMTEAGRDLYEKTKGDSLSEPKVEKDLGWLQKLYSMEFKEDPASIGKP